MYLTRFSRFGEKVVVILAKRKRLSVDRRPFTETDVRIDCTPVTASISTPAEHNARGATSAQKREKPLTLPPKLRFTPVAGPSRRVPYDDVHPTAVVRDVGQVKRTAHNGSGLNGSNYICG